MNIKRKLRQFAVYWAPAEADETGRQGYAGPVEIKCRWEDVQQLQEEANAGDNWVSKSTVYVDRELQLQGVLWKGKLADLPTPAEPFANPGAEEIKKRSSLPDARATESGTLRVVYV